MIFLMTSPRDHCKLLDRNFFGLSSCSELYDVHDKLIESERVVLMSVMRFGKV